MSGLGCRQVCRVVIPQDSNTVTTENSRTGGFLGPTVTCGK